jgi:enoyl-CoA hydratase/carnithine racemase
MTVANSVTLPLSDYQGRGLRFAVDGKVATITLDRPLKKNPLTFESYAELADIFRAAARDKGVKAFVVAGAGGNFSSGGDVFEIIGPLVEMETTGLLDFTRMTGEVVKAMRACPQPIVAAVDGVCAGAGAIIAMAADIRVGTADAKVAFLFNRVGLAGCDMGACAILPRIVGQGRAAELLYTGRVLGGEEAERWGFFNRLAGSDTVLAAAQALARELAGGPTFANAMTKRMLETEWAMSVEAAIETEAVPRLSRLCGEADAGVRGQLTWCLPTRSPGRSSTIIIAASRLPWRAGPMRRLALCRMTTSTRPAAPACGRSAKRASSRRWCRPHTAAFIRSSTCARSVWRERSSPSATGLPISPLPCRGSAPARSPCSAPMR